MKLIVGLGNPWPEYRDNRHNVGFMGLSYFARKQGIKLDRSQARARVGRGKIAGEDVLLARPQTFINASGESVAKLVTAYNLKPADIIVTHDDLDLPTGKIRLREGGRSGGHNGVQSIIDHLGDPDFVRLKIGIGRPEMDEGSPTDKEQAVIDYVLSDFTPEERKLIDEAIPRVSEALLSIVEDGLGVAMNRFN